jgi:uncharacterized membrane protein
MAVAALVLGIVGCLFFWTVIGGIVLGLVAVVFGVLGIRKARGGRAPRRVMAWFGLVLGVLAAVASALILALGVSILNSSGFKDYKDCLVHATTQADKDQCAKDYAHKLSK